MYTNVNISNEIYADIFSQPNNRTEMLRLPYWRLLCLPLRGGEGPLHLLYLVWWHGSEECPASPGKNKIEVEEDKKIYTKEDISSKSDCISSCNSI